jgi:hypothetical protein
MRNEAWMEANLTDNSNYNQVQERKKYPRYPLDREDGPSPPPSGLEECNGIGTK